MKAMSPKAKKITKIVVDVVFWIFFVFALAFTVLAFTAQSSPTGYPTIGGKCFLTVQSDSMKSENGFKKGDLIISYSLPKVNFQNKETEQERYDKISKLEVGQVITFRYYTNEGTILNSHRITKITDPSSYTVENFESTAVFTTKGDNVIDSTESVAAADIVAIWTGKKIAGLGSFINFLQPPQAGFFIFIIVPLAGFLAYEIVVLVLNVKKMKATEKGDKRSITAAEEELIKQKAIEEFLKKQEAEKKDEKSEK